MKIVNINELSNLTIDGIFICSAGFEERSSVIYNNMRFDKESEIIIFKINSKYDKNDATYELMLKNHAEVLKTGVDLYYNDPIMSFNSMIEIFKEKFNDKVNITIDISSFTHEHLLILLRIINEFRSRGSIVRLLYSKAKKYAISDFESEEAWLTRGVEDVRSIVGYSGYFDPSKQNHLVIQAGFEIERVVKVIEQFEYDKITVCMGGRTQSISEELYNTNLQCITKIKEVFPEIDILEISLTDSKKSVEILTSLIKENEHYNHVIVTLNNKISAVAAGLVSINNPDVQVCYITATDYNHNNYSVASEEVIMFEL